MVPGTYLTSVKLFGAYFLFFPYFPPFPLKQNGTSAPIYICIVRIQSGNYIGVNMRKRRRLVEGAFYHVTSRTNNKIRIFNRKLGRRIMLMVLEGAKEKYEFGLTNFCIMPTHIHLLIRPAEGTDLSKIMCWIKSQFAKSWNYIHKSTDHVWGHRYFSIIIKDYRHYGNIMDYIDQNPVKAGLTLEPEWWEASGAYHKAKNLTHLVDFYPFERSKYIKCFPVPGTP